MSENKELNKMVENGNSRPMESRISKGDLLKELKRIELMSFWKKMTDEEKMDYILGRADYEIVYWHHDIMEGRRKSAFSMATWKELAILEFGKKQTKIGDIYRLKQKENERISEFIARIKRESKGFFISVKEQTEIVAEGLLEGREEVKSFILKNEVLNEEMYERIDKLEELCQAEMKKMNEMKPLVKKMESLQIRKPVVGSFICYTCKKEGHMARNCPNKYKINSKRNNSVNEVVEDEEMDDILKNKDTLVYLDNKKFVAVFDSGAKSNFISKSVVRMLGLKVHNNTKIIKLLTCLDEEFQCTEHVITEMKYRNSVYRVKFYVLTKVEREKILIGRVSLGTIMKNEKPKYECEIETEPGKRVVEKIYSLPKKLEAGIDIAMND